jgi:hypothetical protein
VTTPSERMKSLRWAWELLGELQQDLALSAELRHRAEELTVVFPSPEKWSRALDGDASALPSGLGPILEDARALLEAVRSSGTGAEQTRRSVQFTLRHYPPSSAAWFRAESQFVKLMREWIAKEDDTP